MSYNHQALDVKRIDRYEDKTSKATSSTSSSKRKGKIESCSTKIPKQRKTSSRTIETCDIMSMDDPRSPHHVQRNVQCVIETWGHVAPVCPEHFLNQLLSSRGYCHDYINALGHRINP